MGKAIYAIAIGSNRPGRWGGPQAMVAAAVERLGDAVVAASPIVASAPLGPSIRRFANAVVLIESDVFPDELLHRLKAIERAFGRRPGRRWGARPIDLDIVLWSQGAWGGRGAPGGAGVIVPHPAFRARGFVLEPLVGIAPGWRDPVSGLAVRHLAARLRRARPVGGPVDRRATRA